MDDYILHLFPKISSWLGAIFVTIGVIVPSLVWQMMSYIGIL